MMLNTFIPVYGTVKPFNHKTNIFYGNIELKWYQSIVKFKI